jgi:DNA-binding response OmpR family regulator
MNKKVLVADDDPSILESLSLMLEDAGYKVTTISNGKEIENIDKNLPNLFLLDIWMNGMNGNDVCKKLKSQPSTQNIPIILISAHKDIEKITKECGAQDFIVKPFDMDDLLDKFAKYTQ